MKIPQNCRVDGKSFLPQILGAAARSRSAIFDWYQNTPREPLLEYAYDGHYKIYRSGRFYHDDTDPMDVHPLEVAKLAGDDAAAYARLKQTLDENQFVRTTGVEVTRGPPESMKAGQAFAALARVLPAGATQWTLRWQSSDPAVAAVNKWGVIRALKPGRATITVGPAFSLEEAPPRNIAGDAKAAKKAAKAGKTAGQDSGPDTSEAAEEAASNDGNTPLAQLNKSPTPPLIHPNHQGQTFEITVSK